MSPIRQFCWIMLFLGHVQGVVAVNWSQSGKEPSELITSGTPATYSAEEIHGRVVDARTGEPIIGAVVVANWNVFRTNLYSVSGLPVTDGQERLFQVYEAVTSSDGRYVIPAWGPLRPPSEWLIASPRDPKIAVFKAGYDPEYRLNYRWQSESQTGPPFNESHSPVLRYVANGQNVALYKYGTKKQNAMVSDPSLSSSLDRETRQKVWAFAAHLGSNVLNADDSNAPLDSRSRLDAIQSQRQAILFANEELQKLDFPKQFIWQPTVINEFLQK